METGVLTYDKFIDSKQGIMIIMIPKPYDKIVVENSHYLTSISDENLSKYFESCFNAIIK